MSPKCDHFGHSSLIKLLSLLMQQQIREQSCSRSVVIMGHPTELYKAQVSCVGAPKALFLEVVAGSIVGAVIQTAACRYILADRRGSEAKVEGLGGDRGTEFEQ